MAGTPKKQDSEKTVSSVSTSRTPSFMLPQNITTISEGANVRGGFPINADFKGHESMMFSGFMPLQDTELRALETTANVDFKSYECLKTIETAIALLAKSRDFPDPKRSRKERRKNITN